MIGLAAAEIIAGTAWLLLTLTPQGQVAVASALLPAPSPVQTVIVLALTSTPTLTPTRTPTRAPTRTPTPAPPTETPTSPPVRAAALPTGKLSEQEMRDVLALAGWSGDDIPRALSVTHCESNWNPDSDSNPPYVGLFQIDAGFWFPKFGLPVQQAYDPVMNATVARWIFAQSGWSPWPVCGKG